MSEDRTDSMSSTLTRSSDSSQKSIADWIKFSVIFEISLDKTNLDYVVSPTLTYGGTKWCLRLYPFETLNENVALAVYYLGGGGSITADCTLKILNHKSANLSITKEIIGVCFRKFYPDNSVGVEIGGNSLLHSKYGFVANGLLSVKADFCIKSSLNSSRGHSLISQLANILFDESTSDLAIFVGYEQIAAHKVILCLRSSVFREMFSHQPATDHLNELVISDFDGIVVRCFLSFVYTDTVDSYTLSLHAKELFSIASRFQVKRLVAICEEYLSAALSAENVLEIMLLAETHESSELKSDAVEFVVMHFAEVFAQAGGALSARLGLKLCDEVLSALAVRVLVVKDVPSIYSEATTAVSV